MGNVSYRVYCGRRKRTPKGQTLLAPLSAGHVSGWQRARARRARRVHCVDHIFLVQESDRSNIKNKKPRRAHGGHGDSRKDLIADLSYSLARHLRLHLRLACMVRSGA